MSLNIIDLVKGQLGPALVSQAATKLGESESGISKAINGLLPVVLGGLTDNVGKPGVFDAIKGAATSGILGNLLGGSADNSIISSILPMLFGDKKDGVIGEVAKYAGISNNSSNSLLNMVTGATLGSVGKYAADNNLDASGVTNLLENQKSGISSLLPVGFSLGALGLGGILGGVADKVTDVTDTVVDGVGSVASKTADAVKDTASATVGVADTVVSKVGDTASKVVSSTTSFGSSDNDNKGGSSIWKWLLPLLLACAAAFFLWKRCCPAGTDTNATTTENVEGENGTNEGTATATMDDKDANVDEGKGTREAMEVELPNGTKLNAFKGGIEDQVVTFLNSDEYKDASDEDLKTKWFNFDNLNFEFNSPKLTQESNDQINNIIAILKAYPEAKLKLGSYSDKKGDDNYNLQLSQKRADAVKIILDNAGVGTQVTGAEGYGEKFAEVAEDASDEEREADRKTAIRFVK